MSDAHQLPRRLRLFDLLPMAVQTHLPQCLLCFELNSAQLVACGAIALLTGVNIRGVREGAMGTVANPREICGSSAAIGALRTGTTPFLGYLRAIWVEDRLKMAANPFYGRIGRNWPELTRFR